MQIMMTLEDVVKKGSFFHKGYVYYTKVSEDICISVCVHKKENKQKRLSHHAVSVGADRLERVQCLCS